MCKVAPTVERVVLRVATRMPLRRPISRLRRPNVIVSRSRSSCLNSKMERSRGDSSTRCRLFKRAGNALSESIAAAEASTAQEHRAGHPRPSRARERSCQSTGCCRTGCMESVACSRSPGEEESKREVWSVVSCGRDGETLDLCECRRLELRPSQKWSTNPLRQC